MNRFIAGVAVVDIFSGDQLIAHAKTLIDSSISISSTPEDVRGGEGNALLGRYFHSSMLELTLTETMFKLEYLAMQTGSTISTGSDMLTTEQITLGAGGTGTVSGTPVAFGDSGLVGWASIPGQDEYLTVNFTGSSFTVAGAQQGDVYCIKYMSTDDLARKIVISSNFVPETVRLIMTANLWSGDSSGGNRTLAGKVQVDVPRFQFSGTQDISMTAAGVSNTPLSGSALVIQGADCDGGGQYAIITERISNAKWYDNIFDLAIAGGDIELESGDTSTLVVRGLPKSGATVLVKNTNLTFTSRDTGVATVDADGVVTAVAAGSTVITAVIPEKPTVEGIASVTVV